MNRPTQNRRGPSRRNFLRGAGGLCLALPFLESMSKPAQAADPKPLRFVSWLGWFGSLPQYWMGPGEGSNFEWGDITRPLDPIRSKVSVLSGINMASVYKQYGRNGNHSIGGAAMLTSAPEAVEYWGTADFHGSTGPSIESVISNRLDAVTKFKTLNVGDSSDHLHSVTVPEGESASLINPIWNPSQLFDMLFAEFGGDAEQRERLRVARRSILDAAMPEYESLSKKVSSADKQLIDRHLASLREIEVSVNAVAECSPPEAPANSSWDVYDTSQAKERYRLLFDMVAVALACDLTRVATVSLSAFRASSRDIVPNLDDFNPEFPEMDVHGFSHGHWREPGQTAVWREILTWRTTMLRDFAMKLDAIPEGEGTTVLDNTVIVHTSEIMTGLHDEMPLQEWGYANILDDAPARMTGLPILFIGGAGGALKTGQHFRLDKTHTYAEGLGKYSHGEMYLTIARALGIDAAALPTFGDPDVCKNVIEEILT